ncbi:hypothetical protein RCH20_002451 [Psychrobacter sp. PL15]|jgi:hypothetical protein|uniref:hypothetical protein n=1 Tax=Psychrobacter sp. PL15 TaxID=3071719 RepID=UPI002E03E898|nr:hypothetical protein [Psychrobacter sp. PL15]
MKIITMYIENDKAEMIYKSGEHVHECIYIPSSHIANLIINTYDDWNVELDEEEIKFIANKIGKFKAYSITWKSDISLYEYVISLSDKLNFILDNDKGNVNSNKEIAAMSFNEFLNWIS